MTALFSVILIIAIGYITGLKLTGLPQVLILGTSISYFVWSIKYTTYESETHIFQAGVILVFLIFGMTTGNLSYLISGNSLIDIEILR